MYLKPLSILTLLLFALVTIGCGEKEKERTVETKTEEKPALYTLQDGNETIRVTLKDEGLAFDTKEPVVLLNFFATWCPPCKAEIPHLVSLQKSYAGKLKVVAVLVEEHVPNRVVERFRSEHAINYFLSNGPDNMRLATVTADMLHQPKNFPIPLMVLFVDGRYFRHYVGMVPEEMLESDIKDALKEAKK
ncbi:TlpA family protein disulfide reductase [Hydrogenimonas sp.]